MNKIWITMNVILQIILIEKEILVIKLKLCIIFQIIFHYNLFNNSKFGRIQIYLKKYQLVN